MTVPEEAFLDKNLALFLRAPLRLWRFCLFLPFLYVGLGWWADRSLFEGEPGWFRLEGAASHGLLAGLALLVLATEGVLLVLRRRFRLSAQKLGADFPRWQNLYWKRTLYMAGCADTVCFLGLAHFLLQGNWIAFFVCLAAAYLFYAQAYPRGEQLKIQLLDSLQ